MQFERLPRAALSALQNHHDGALAATVEQTQMVGSSFEAVSSNMKRRRRTVVACLSLLAASGSCQSVTARTPAAVATGNPALLLLSRHESWPAPGERSSGRERGIKRNVEIQAQGRRSAFTKRFCGAHSSPISHRFARFPLRGGGGGGDSSQPADDDDDNVTGVGSSRHTNNEGSSDDDSSGRDPPLLSAATVLETTTTTVLEPVEGDGVGPAASAFSSSVASPPTMEESKTPTDGARINATDASDESLDSAPEEQLDAIAVSDDDVAVHDDDTDSPESGASAQSSVAGEDIDEALLAVFDPEESLRLRARGKELHDAGQYAEAADLFRQASMRLVSSTDDDDGNTSGSTKEEEYATCRLHEALCRLKAGGIDQANRAVVSCASVLDRRDGLPNVLVARAYHRRAKAHVALDQPDDALRDARSAAFLGDRKAVALYGKLLRDHPGEAGALGGTLGGDGDGQSWLGPSQSSDASSSLLDLLMSAGTSGDKPGVASSPLDGMSPGGFPFLPQLSGLGGGDTGSLAKSVLSSLSKKIRDESTQASICSFLQQTSPSQIRSFAGMAGLPLAEKQADQLARFCNGITPSTLQRWIRLGSRVSYGVRIVQKVLRVISKYRALLLVVCLLAWTKSAILRPLPVSKAARKAARLAASAATATAAIPTP